MKKKSKPGIDTKKLAAHDPMKEIRRAIEAISYRDPLKEFRQALELTTLRNPLREYQEAMKNAIVHQDPLKEYKEAMKIAAFSDPMNDLREAIKANVFSDPMKDLREAMNTTTFSDPLKDLREVLKANAFNDPMKEIREAIKTTSFNELTARTAYSSLTGLKNSLETLSLAHFSNSLHPKNWPETDQRDLEVVLKENSIVVDNESFGLEELNEHFEFLSKQFHENLTTSFEDAVNKLISEIKAQDNTVLQKLLTYILYPFIVALCFSLINPIADHYIKEYLKRDKGSQEVHTKTSRKSSTNKTSTLRIVTSQMLNVREEPNSASRKIGILTLGDIVKSIKKDGKWTFIRWTDKKHNTEIKGWVFTRYTKEIVDKNN